MVSPADLSADKLTAFAGALDTALAAGDVACLQLRLKGADETPVPDDEIRRAVARLLPVTQEHDVAFILNDRPDLAAELGCDGVHVGQEDASYADARRILGDDAIVGVTCHDSRHLALEAAEAGADYVAFGAFFDTGTKTPKSRAGRDVLTWWSDITEVPCVAIGGITAGNCAPIVEAGADFLAVSAGVWAHPDGPGAAVRAFNAACS
ncbi:MAG: thiamine phosphate synthase [Alphaproteobacteria bacterium]